MPVPSPWEAENAAALLLRAMLMGPLTINIFHAAIGGRFDATLLAYDLNAIWHASDNRQKK